MTRHASKHETIESLVERARAGDLEAFERLVAHYQDRVYNYVLRMIYDPMEAQDVAQETFVRAWQGLPRFRGASSFQTWLYRIASNLAIDAARSRKRRGLVTVSLDEPVAGVDSSELEHDLPDEGRYAPAEFLEQEELRQQVWQAVGELSDKLRPVIVLADLQGLSYGEIAKILGCPVGTVKSRLFNARSQLRDKLRERLPVETIRAWSGSPASPSPEVAGMGGSMV
jgi:RNA polymerase sigma-70 factor (ECF subfamily)